jgi:TolB-like protein
MHGPSLPSDGFFGRLKSHKVIEWTLAYAALAYTVLHGVEMVAGALSWPHAIARVLTLVLILGIPVIATLAWYHGAQRLKKISGPELAILTVLLFIAGTLLWGFAGTGEEHNTTLAPVIEKSTGTPNVVEPAPATVSAPRTAVAVLPFANLTGDASKEYLGDGMAEAMINTLTKVPGLTVPARTSTFAYKGRGTDIRQIAKDLGVGTILEGSVQAAGKRLRITAQLINAQDGLHLWSETYDEEFTDIFKLQDKLVNAIALALEPKLAGPGTSPVTPTLPTQDVEAYNLYLQGWSLVERVSLENEQRAIAYFQQALARDPKFALAHAGMAQAYLSAVTAGAPLEEGLAAAERGARQALALDADLAYPHLTLAGVASSRGQALEAESHDLAALSLASNDGFVNIIRAIHLARVGRLQAAHDAGQRAYALAPANPFVLAYHSLNFAIAGRDVEASRYAAAAVDLGFPKDTFTLQWVASLAALHSGHYAEAAAVWARLWNDSRIAEVGRLANAARENPDQRSRALKSIALLFPAAAIQSEAAAAVGTPCLSGVLFMATVGGLNEAFELTNRCLSNMESSALSSVSTILPVWYPEMRQFRRDARFGALVSRVGLMEYFRQYGPPDDCEINDNKLKCH